jgi:nucleotide-binding universal stress UspA family protein
MGVRLYVLRGWFGSGHPKTFVQEQKYDACFVPQLVCDNSIKQWVELMKILVPTDFSRPSRQAALYAARWAQAVGGEMILLHVIDLRPPHMVTLSLAAEERITQARQEEAKEECKQLIAHLSQKVEGVPMSADVTEGNPLEEMVENYALRHEIGLIVIGTHGVTGFEKAVFGSNAILMMHRSTFPLIMVPEYCRFAPLHHIVCASSMATLHRELKALIPMAQAFGATIHIFHVSRETDAEEQQRVTQQNGSLEGLGYPSIVFHLSHETDVVEAIQEFVADSEADLLVLYPHEGSFFQDMFRTHITDEIAFRSLVPLLTFRI